MSKTTKAIAAARKQLVASVKAASLANGEALWTNGYRTARMACGAESQDEDARLYNKEVGQHELAGNAERQVARAITNYAAAIRRSFNPMRKRK